MTAGIESSIHVTDILRMSAEQELGPLLPNSICWEHFDLPTQSFPRVVYDNNASSHFGYFADLLLRLQLHCVYPNLCDVSRSDELEQIIFAQAMSKGKDGWKEFVTDMIKHTGWSLPSDLANWNCQISRVWSLFSKFARDIGQAFINLSENPETTIPFNVELFNGSGIEEIQGHPDIIWYGPSHNGIIDIKTVRKPSTNCVCHMAQVCAYAAMLKEQGKQINYIGIYYPLQKEPMVLFNLPESWDHLSYLSFLKAKASSISTKSEIISGEELSQVQWVPSLAQVPDMSSECAMFALIFASMKLPPGMGHHVHGCSELLNSISNISNLSVQAFLTPRTGCFPDYDIEKIKNTLIANNLVGFSHMPYYINICKPETKMYPDPIVSLGTPIRELNVANQMGLRGCVIHVGKDTKKKGFNQAWNDMKYYTLWLVCHAHISCPLLLETCCGAGTEMLSDVESFCDFYEEIIKDYPLYYKQVYNTDPTSQAPFGLCLDSCHIFVSGAKLDEFIGRVVEKVGIEAIKLVHYNDSKKPRGSHADRHEVPSFGQIPIEELYWVYQFCLKHNIPMVRE